MPPVEHIALAAELGCGAISLAPAPFTANPHGYPAWSLRDNPALRREVRAALAAKGIALRLGEGFLIRPGSDVGSSADDLDLMAEIGAERVNVLSIDADAARSLDELGRLADLAAARGLVLTLEWMAGMAIGTLAQSVAAIRAVGRGNLKLLVDTMHLARSGGTAAELAVIDPALIGYVQLCDCPVKPLDASYGEEARHNRLALGQGDLPLAELIAALPQQVLIGLELPMLVRAEAGEGPRERLAASVAFAKSLVGEAP